MRDHHFSKEIMKKSTIFVNFAAVILKIWCCRKQFAPSAVFVDIFVLINYNKIGKLQQEQKRIVCQLDWLSSTQFFFYCCYKFLPIASNYMLIHYRYIILLLTDFRLTKIKRIFVDAIWHFNIKIMDAIEPEKISATEKRTMETCTVYCYKLVVLKCAYILFFFSSLIKSCIEPNRFIYSLSHQ